MTPQAYLFEDFVPSKNKEFVNPLVHETLLENIGHKRQALAGYTWLWLLDHSVLLYLVTCEEPHYIHAFLCLFFHKGLKYLETVNQNQSFLL